MAVVLLVGVLLLSMILIALGLPGLWVMIASAVVYNIVVGGSPIGWFTLVCVGILALIAEIIEWTLSGKFARKYGGSRRAAWGAVIGGTLGAIMGFPLPIVGPLIGAFVGSFVGALVGGFLFHLIGALSQYGKLGMTAIGNSREEVEALYQRTLEILARETGGGGEGREPRF